MANVLCKAKDSKQPSLTHSRIQPTNRPTPLPPNHPPLHHPHPLNLNHTTQNTPNPARISTSSYLRKSHHLDNTPPSHLVIRDSPNLRFSQTNHLPRRPCNWSREIFECRAAPPYSRTRAQERRCASCSKGGWDPGC